MTWSISLNAPSKAAAKVAVTLELPKAMSQRPHARDFDVVRNAINGAIDACEEGAVTVTANGHVDYSGWDADVPTLHGVTMSLSVYSKPA